MHKLIKLKKIRKIIVRKFKKRFKCFEEKLRINQNSDEIIKIAIDK